MEKVNAIGRRKAAVARVYLTEGSGNIVIDKRPIDVYFPLLFSSMLLSDR